jgi:Periplasmic copper-binding protein (NosD)
MRKITAILFFLPFIFMGGCQKDLLNQEAIQPKLQADEGQYFEPSEAFLTSLEAMKNEPTLATRGGCEWISIPAGSIDALQHAVDGARAGSVIYLKRGNHIENKAITIKKTVYIFGESGAVLSLKSALTLPKSDTGPLPMNPAIHFLNAPNSAILDVDIQTSDAGGATGLLFENSNQCTVMRCKITNFQFSIWVEKSDKMSILRNTIVSTTKWQTGEATEAECITIANGKSCYIGYNEVSNALFGIWACDKSGICEKNYAHHNFIGIILCNVPQGYYQMPDGTLKGALVPGTAWKTRNNKSTDNQYGYLAIDGANNNLIENNDAARNAAYDMELTTDTYRFGFLTPKSYENTVNVGNYPNIRIKDCGLNNHINGGIKVNTATDPCN